MKKLISLLLLLCSFTVRADPISFGNYSLIQLTMGQVTINTGRSDQWMVATSGMTQAEATALAQQVSTLKPGPTVWAIPIPEVMAKFSLQGMLSLSYHCYTTNAYEFLSVGGDRTVLTAFTAPTPSGNSWTWTAGSVPPPGTNSWCYTPLP